MESRQQLELKAAKHVLQTTHNTKSRRLVQQRKQRLIKKVINKHNCNGIGLARKYHTEQYCLHNFGFCANPAQSISKNFKSALGTTPLHSWLQPKNLAFHNLCKQQKLPTGAKELLGLDLKFCLSSIKITNDIHKTTLQMAKTIRTRFFLRDNGITESSTYEKQIYIKNMAWNPPPAPLHIEDKITEFEKSLRNLHQQLTAKHKHNKLTNLTPFQVKTLKELKNNKDVTIKPTDKNLGPAILDTNQYISQVLKERLLTPAYRQLSHLEAIRTIENIKTTLKNLIQTNA